MGDEIKLTKTLRLISIFLLLFALGSLPYFYYQILRWVVCGTALYTGWIFHQSKQRNWAWLFFIIGIVFNPIEPFSLGSGIWSILNIVVAIIFIFSLTKKTNNT